MIIYSEKLSKAMEQNESYIHTNIHSYITNKHNILDSSDE